MDAQWSCTRSKETLTSPSLQSSTKRGSAKSAKAHNAKGKSFCNSEASNSAGAITVASRDKRYKKAPQSSKPKNTKTQKHHFRKALKNMFERCAERWKKEADYRKCTQERQSHSRNWTSEADNMTPQPRLAQFGEQRNHVQTTAGGSHATTSRQHPELGQAHRARLVVCQSARRVNASQVGDSSAVIANYFSPHNANH